MNVDIRTKKESVRFLEKHPNITLLLFIMAVVASQLWYEVIYQFIKDTSGVQKLDWWQIGIVAVAFTALFYFLMHFVFKTNFAAVI